MPTRNAEARWDGALQEGNGTMRIDKLEQGFGITRIELDTRARVPGVDEDEFQRVAEAAKKGCPVSRALGGVDSIELRATLVE
jgi:osmotically inducible protein OsmC